MKVIAFDQINRPTEMHRTDPGALPSIRMLSAGELDGYRDAWEELARAAKVPNVFYEPWMLLPALEHTLSRKDLYFLLVFGPDRQGVEPLWGFFPLEVQHWSLHLPLATMAFWQYRGCQLTAPLLHADHVEQALLAFRKWFENTPLGCSLLDTKALPADGPFHSAWADLLTGRCTLLLDEHARGLQTRADDFESYISRVLSKKRYHGICRTQHHLEALGTLEYTEVRRPAGVDAWVDQFLELEASVTPGKGDGSEAVRRSADVRFFRTMTAAGFRESRTALISLLLNGRPVAMKQILLADDGGSFIFKTAYDHSYARFSPGVLLELEHLRRWHAGLRIDWVDTCAPPSHSLFNLISNERRVIRRSLVSNGSRWGDLLTATLPLWLWLYRQVGPPAPAA